MIFYFSATGNSKHAAQYIADDSDTIVSITEAMKTNTLTYDCGDSVIFVIPTYFYGIPDIVIRFIEKAEFTLQDDAYISLVLTCGATTGNAGNMFKQLLAKRSIHLSSVFSVKMVDNYLLLFNIPDDDKIVNINLLADKQIAKIASMIHHRKSGDYNNLKSIVPHLLTAVAYPMYHFGRSTKKFRATNDLCTGCGLCKQLCPENAIDIKNGIPEWTAKQCNFCLACINHCPNTAIEYGKRTVGKKRYVIQTTDSNQHCH